MEDIQHGIIEDFGLGYVKFGHSELMGRVVGLLMSETEPRSIDEICEALNVTKTPVNQLCRRLEERKLIRRIRIRGERKYHYQISPEVFLQAGINLARLFEENLHIAEKHLHALVMEYSTASTEERAKLKIIGERLIAMREFHLRELKSYKKFIDQWKVAKARLPSADEYIEKMDTGADLEVTTIDG